MPALARTLTDSLSRSLSDSGSAALAAGEPLAGGRYTRLFPELPALAIEPDLLRAIGRAGGLSDATNGGSSEARMIAAARPVFGQYLAHDLTADRSPLAHHDDAELLRNAHRARLDLEPLYGEGPVGNPYLYSLPIRPGSCWAGSGRARRTTCPATRKASPWPATRARTSTC